MGGPVLRTVTRAAEVDVPGKPSLLVSLGCEDQVLREFAKRNQLRGLLIFCEQDSSNFLLLLVPHPDLNHFKRHGDSFPSNPQVELVAVLEHKTVATLSRRPPHGLRDDEVAHVSLCVCVCVCVRVRVCVWPQFFVGGAVARCRTRAVGCGPM